MKTTIEMPDDLLQLAKAAALARGWSLKHLVTQAVEHELGRNYVRQDSAGAHQRSERFSLEITRLAALNSAAWTAKKSALEQLFEDRDARNY
ncbi:MAG: hypothetical protein HKM01_01980 [Gallionella sp.]|jgi:hypothetical protein|nr:hypothetical protein [Gallionella sp.]